MSPLPSVYPETENAFEAEFNNIQADTGSIGQPTIKVVGYVCDGAGRHPQVEKVTKIVNWQECKNLYEVRAFLGTAGRVQ